MKSKLYQSLLVIFLLLFASCQENNNEGDDVTFSNLVFSDEFNTDGAVDDSKWIFDIGTGAEIGLPGWGNNELQYYTDRPENIRVRDGMLEITARQENFEGSNYTSAKILTKGIFETTFGRFEARIQLPFGQGIWPAFWLLGDDPDGQGTDVEWPQIGEIDIMEYRGQQPTIVHGSVHGPNYCGSSFLCSNPPPTASYTLSGARFDTEFYVFAIEWGPDFIDYYVNDTLYNTISPDDIGDNEWVFNDNTFYIILNTAVGGGFVGNPNSSTPFPQTMYVDYVRVYGMDN